MQIVGLVLKKLPDTANREMHKFNNQFVLPAESACTETMNSAGFVAPWQTSNTGDLLENTGCCFLLEIY